MRFERTRPHLGDAPDAVIEAGTKATIHIPLGRLEIEVEGGRAVVRVYSAVLPEEPVMVPGCIAMQLELEILARDAIPLDQFEIEMVRNE